MTKASDNEFPSLLVKEGSAPSSPAAGDQRVYIDSSDHKLKRKNSSGTVTVVEGLADTGVITYLDGTVASAPATPAAGKLRLYAKTGKVLAVKDDAGVETVLGAGGGAKSYVTQPALKPPASPVTGDIEFLSHANAVNPTAGPGMTWGNQGSATAAVNNGRLIMNSATTAGARALLIATPGSGNFQMDTMLETFQYLATQWAGFIMLWGTPGSPTNIRAAGRYWNTASTQLIVWSTLNTSWVATADVASLTATGLSPNPTALRIEWDGTNLIFKASPNGLVGTFAQVTSQALGLGRPDYVGLAVNTNNAADASIAAFNHLRFNWTADFDPTTSN